VEPIDDAVNASVPSSFSQVIRVTQQGWHCSLCHASIVSGVSCALTTCNLHWVVQIVFGLERLVDLTIAKAVPPVAYGTTVTIRFVNNVIGESTGAPHWHREVAVPDMHWWLQLIYSGG
jgi:hypothetical protein